MSLLGTIGAALAAAVFPGQKRRGPEPPAFLTGARLSYASQGRDGEVHFWCSFKHFRMYYEFGGANVLALISVPEPKQWTAETGLPLAQRDEVLHFIAIQVIADQTTTGRNRYEIGNDCITIFE